MFTLFFDGIAFTQNVNAATAAKLSKKTVSVKVGKKAKNKLTAASYKAGWRITKATVKKTAVAKAKVKKNKKVVVVTGIKKGATKIVLKLKNTKTGAAKKLTFKAKVTVPVNPIDGPVDEVTLSKTDVTLNVDETMELTADTTPRYQKAKTITWESSDTNIVSVENGLITAKAVGEATITATSEGKSATCKITVVYVPVDKLILSESAFTLRLNESMELKSVVSPEALNKGKELTAAVYPEDAPNKNVSWTSSDSEIISISGKYITARKTGTATITAKAEDKTATCEITVVERTKKIAVKNIKLNQAECTLVVGHTKNLDVIATPWNANIDRITWKSWNPDIASVKHGKITANAPGNAIITATVNDKITTACRVTVLGFQKDFHPTSSMTVPKSSYSLYLGETTDLIFDLKNSLGTVSDDIVQSVDWELSDVKGDIVLLDNGRITAIKTGTQNVRVTVTTMNPASSREFTKLYNIQVKEPKEYAPYGNTSSPKDTIILDKDTMDLQVGDSSLLMANVQLAKNQYTSPEVVWRTEDPSIAVVSATGVVHAIAEGKTTITATIKSPSGGITASCTVNVKPVKPVTPPEPTDPPQPVYPDNSGNSTDPEYPVVIPVTNVTLDNTDLEITVGEKRTLKASVLPDNATDKSVTWNSNNLAVATVSESGEITAVSVGTAIITAQAGDVAAFCTITINPIAVTGINLSQSSLNLKVGESQTLTATVAPDNAMDKTVTWTSDNTAVATVSESGEITAVSVGTATITAKAGDKTAECTVTVNPIAVTAITLSSNGLGLKIGESQTLTATVTPDNAMDKTVTWTSDNTAVATVSESGEITAVSVGTATIIAKAGDKTAECTVTVNPIAVTAITLNSNTLALKVSESQTLTAAVTPDNATDKTVTWTSSDERVAVVSGGAITAIAAGNAIVTAKAGDKTAECTVTVTKIEAQAPQITNANTLPQSIRFNSDWMFSVDNGDVAYLNGTVGYSIKVNANVEDGGTLSYQWYLADSSEGVGRKINNEISDTITIKEGSIFEDLKQSVDNYKNYLYVVVTNTKDGETKETVSQRITIDYKTNYFVPQNV